MPQLGSSGIQALVSSFTEKDVDQALKEIAKKIARSVDDVNDQLNKISIDKDVIDNIVNQLKALPEEVRKKAQGMSFDLFSDLINADGAEEKIDEAFKTFTNKIQSFVKLRDQIGNDEIIIKADYSQIDELIRKTGRLLELQKELDKWQKGMSPKTKVSIEGDISNLESEIKSGIANLNVNGEQVGVGVNVDNEALTELDKKIKETEESLKSAREEAEKYGGSLKDLKDKINETYNKSINKDNQKNADAFRKSVIDYKKAGGSEKDLSKDILSWYKLSESSWPKNFVPLDQISNDVDDVQKKIKELEKTLMGLYKQRESLTKGSIVDTEGIGSDESKIKDQEQEIGRLKDKLQQVNQKYAEQSNFVDELENKLKALEGINNPKVIETDEYKNIISELETAKNKASEFQNEMNELRQTTEVLKNILSSYNTGDVVPRQDFENANRVIDNLSNKINELEISLTETKNKFTSLSEEVTKLQQDKSDLSGQLSQQKEINAAQQEQISNSQKIKIELDEIKKKYQDLTNSIEEMESTQSRYMSLLDKFGQAEAFNKAIQNVDYNEGRNTPEGFVNFDYLDKAKQKLQETGNAYEKATKAAVYYYQYLQKGGTEKIFNKDGKDISGELISLYKEMSSLADTKTGQISYESINKTVREYANELRLAKEEQSREKELINQKNKELKETLSLEKNIAKTKQENQKTEEQTKDTTVKSSGKKNMSKEEFIEFSIARQREQQVNQEDSSNISRSLQQDSSSILSEQQALEKLEQAIISVTTMIGQKNLAIQAEEVQMNQSVNQEIAKLEKLKGKLNEIKTEFENGIASRLFKDTDGNDTTVLGEVTLSPKLSDTFKTDADKLLDDINIEKEVELKITGLNDSNQNIENIKKQIESATEDVNLSDSYNPNQFNELLSKDFSTKGKKEATSQLREAYNEFKQYYNDLDKLNTAEGQKAAYNYYKSYEEAINQNISKTNLERYTVANDIYNNEDLNNEIDLATRSMKLFSEVQNELGNIKIDDSIAEHVSKLTYNLREFEKVKSDLDNNVPRLESVDEVDGNLKSTYSMEATKKEYEELSDTVTYFETILKSEISYAKEFGETLTQSAQKAESAIAEVNDELSKPQQPQMKPVEGQTENLDQDEKKSGVIQVPVEPLLDQTSWENEIDRILEAIGTKKIKIEPDISSEAWNSFKTFVDNISKQVINLKVVDKGSYGLPSDLKASYTNSTKYVTELYKIEEKIAQVKESGNQKDLERLATLEAEKKKYEDLLRLEEQFRANEKFKDFDTTSQDNALNKLISTKEQEYQSNRQVAAIRIEEEAYNENQKFDENKKLEKASSLLEQQKAKWEEIQNIRIKISNLDPVNDADEINNLNAQKSSLESELSMIEKELTLYDSLIDKKKQSNELDKIAANADKQVNDNTLDRVNKLYNDYVNNINEQAQLELKGGNRTDEEEQRLVQLRQEYLDLIERINKALTEEQNKTSAISKVLESMKIAKDLGVSGVLRNNDVDQGYEEANKVNNALNEAKKKMEDLEKLGKTDLFKQAFSDANNEIKNLNQQLISGEITLTEYNKKVKEITTSLSKKTNAVAFFDPGDMEKTAQQMKDLAQQLPGLREDTIKWGAGNKQLTAIFQDQNGEWKKLTLNAQTAGKVITATFTNAKKPATTFSKFVDELGTKFRNLGSYLLSFVGFYEIWDQIKQGVTYVKELDSALTEMKKVSDETTESLKAFQEESFDIADSVASTAKEIQNSTADWLRLGYAMDEASELARTTAVYKAVGDDMDIATATESMVSTLQGFQLEADQAANIVDQFNEVSNNFAIDSKGIGDALQRSAASFNAANTGMSEAIALITATNAVLQDPEKVGNMWRTVSARIRGAKQELIEMGEDTDGMVESTSKLRDQIKALTGFDIMEDENTFKNIMDIIIGIGDEWENLTDLEQAGLLEALAGKQQSNALAAALQNVDMIKEVYETAQNADGSAQEELESQLESIEGEILPYLYRKYINRTHLIARTA